VNAVVVDVEQLLFFFKEVINFDIKKFQERLEKMVCVGVGVFILNTGVPKRRTFGPEYFLILCKIFRHGIFNQKLINASGREFYSLYDVMF
jgi:hypothetical protein